GGHRSTSRALRSESPDDALSPAELTTLVSCVELRENCLGARRPRHRASRRRMAGPLEKAQARADPSHLAGEPTLAVREEPARDKNSGGEQAKGNPKQPLTAEFDAGQTCRRGSVQMVHCTPHIRAHFLVRNGFK